MNSHPDFESAIALMGEQMKSLQREFGYVLSGKRHIEHSVNFPNHPEETVIVRKGISNLIEGSLIVYLFAMWEAHVPPDVNEWLTATELQELNALRHIRDSVAHKYKGGRADFPKRRKAFEGNMPFAGIIWNAIDDTIDLSTSSAAMHCYQIMEKLNKMLVVRLYQNQKPVNAPTT
jgi:hypothetical protein